MVRGYPWLRGLANGHRVIGWTCILLGIAAVPFLTLVEFPGQPPSAPPWVVFNVKLVSGVLLFLLLSAAGAFELAVGESLLALADLADNSAYLVALAREADSRRAPGEALLPTLDDTPRL